MQHAEEIGSEERIFEPNRKPCGNVCRRIEDACLSCSQMVPSCKLEEIDERNAVLSHQGERIEQEHRPVEGRVVIPIEIQWEDPFDRCEP